MTDPRGVELTPEVRAAMAAGGVETTPDDVNRLHYIFQALVQKRQEAIDGRRESGIEEIWRAAEEAYLGIDDSNRGEWAGARWAKPTSLEGPLQATATRRTMTEGARSTVYVRLTARYVDAGTAKVAEILLPADDKAFSLKATPVPDLVAQTGDRTPVMIGGQPAERDPQPHEVPPGTDPGRAPGVPLTVGDVVKERMQIATAAAKRAETRIFDWMTEGKYRPAMRAVIFDMARLGVGILKGPYPTVRRARAVRRVDNGVELQMVSKLAPAYCCVSPWNVYPDPACGENIQDGDYVFETDGISERGLLRLKGQPGYLADQIDQVILEGPERCNIDEEGRTLRDKPRNRHQYTIWYFHGSLSADDMAAMTGQPREKYAGDTVYAVCTMVNDRVIRASVNPLEKSGEHPYHAVPWQRRPGHWAGVGVGEQLNVPQRITNASTRSMLNNAGISSGAQIVVDVACVTPADGNWTIYPNKLWHKNAEAGVDDINKAFAVFQIPNVTQQMMSIIQYGMQLAEEATSIPLITQGMSGRTTPDTYGAAQLQNNNANQLLRNIGYQVDDYITEPAVRQSYEWLLLDPDVPDDEKGDWDISAHGSIALVERAIQDQTILQLGAMVMNPAFGMSPPRWFEQMLKSKRLDPRDFEMTEEEKAKLANQPPPEAPAVAAAKIREAGAMERAKLDAKVDSERAAMEREDRMRELALRREVALLEYAKTTKQGLANIKADLAQTAAKIDLQRELGHLGARAKQVTKPPVEPAGRAPRGQAFQR